MRRFLNLVHLAVLAVMVAALSCGGTLPDPKLTAAERARRDGRTSTDPEVVGRWLLAELVSPGAKLRGAREARKRLEDLGGKGLYASFARAIDDEAHGRTQQAALAHVDVLRAARESRDPLAAFVGWYSSNRLLQLRRSTHGLWKHAEGVVRASMKDPGGLGWRARGELVDWWAREAYQAAQQKNLLDEIAKLHGCLGAVRLVGPFGRGAPSDRTRVFPPESPGRWPVRFQPDPHRVSVVPRILKTERRGCEVRSSDSMEGGIFYAETFVELDGPKDYLLAVQGARAVLVNDVQVLERNPKVWGVWPTFGVLLRLERGRHRIVARLEKPSTSIRLLRRDGTPLMARGSKDAGPSYTTTPPKVLADPNVINRFVRKGGVKPSRDNVATFLAAYVAHVEGQNDVGNVLMEPLVKRPGTAGPLALAQQAMLVMGDPVFPESDARDLAREVHRQVLKKDPGIWQSRFWLMLSAAKKKGRAAVARDLRDLHQRYPAVPDIGRQLVALYGQLGWTAERTKLLAELAKRFPNDEVIVSEHVAVLESLGRVKEADALAARLRRMDPDSELALDRALRRRDYKAAIAELKRLGKLRPDRKSIARRIQAVMTRAGLSRESFDELEQAVKEKPRDGAARLKLADARYAAGAHGALRKAIAAAIQAGADTGELSSALELVEGRTELAPYRLDGVSVIKAYEKAGVQMEGAAVRVLDYGVTWVHSDASSRLLEHEIIRVQSQEAIGKLAEQRIPRGLVLRMRVIKKNGQILEPEFVADKPTLTMPHVEVGDYIETESITATPGDGMDGQIYLGPHWFFREQDIAYWRSEFVVVAPKDRKLIIENHGAVPQPKITEDGSIVVHRWRVDQSPAAVVEPGTVPFRELLPSVRVGWGVSMDRRLRHLVDTLSDQTVADPRLKRIAKRIVHGVPASHREERARRLYRWILANVERGPERDGRRIVVGKSGDLGFGFIYMARLAGIPTEIGVVRDRLAEPPTGPISEAESFRHFVIRVDTESGVRWMTVRDRFTPFGYLPAALRGQNGFLLVEKTPKITTGKSGSFDGVVFEGEVALRPNGSATIQLSRKFVGEFAIRLRRGLEQIPETQRRDVIEGQLLAADLPGASLVDLKVEALDNLDLPLTLRMKVEMPEFARRVAGGLVISPPFSPKLASIATLPARKTPMLISEASRIEVKLRVKLPKGASLASSLATVELKDGDRVASVRDRKEGNDLLIERVFDIPAARIQTNQYRALQTFARQADEATHRDIRITVK